MSEVNWSITDEDIATDVKCREYQNLLAHLLINEVAFLNSHDGGMMQPGQQAVGISVNVLCSDTFGYACADCERLDYEQIPVLYRMWRKDPLYGPTAWAVARRKERPIRPVAESLARRGYDIDALLRGEMP